jgi:hypothetical protein
MLIDIFLEVSGGWRLPLVLVEQLPLESMSLPPLDNDVLLELGPPTKLLHRHGPATRWQISPEGTFHFSNEVTGSHHGVIPLLE